MVILLSPSKTISEETTKVSSNLSRPTFLDEAERLMKKLKKLPATELEKLMSINPTLAEKTAEWFNEWLPLPQHDKARIAAHCFKGAVYTGLNARAWSDSDFVFAQRHLRIVSGLYGLLKPLDRIQPYRLEMGLKWQMEPRYSNLYEYWGTRISDKVEDEANGFIVNLASKEYSKASISKDFKGTIITPEFKEKVGDVYKAKMAYAKEARGCMANFIIKNRMTNPEEIKNFQGMGYAYHPDLSDNEQWVFTR
ncbi:MAG: YaaA family protein [Bacteroidetes bacterium]|nr:YaaA family protein [Bacteroidota bacterium]MDA1336232.1 YaaA family protein [Bacteroidota bacterium]